MTINNWDIVLPPNSTLVKIAEASFAEVYRVTTSNNDTSILKIMQLKVSSDPVSIDMSTTISAETVISEIRIMNAMTEIPGFVTFKDAHIIKGKPGLPIKEAYEHHRQIHLLPERKDSDFPDPDDYTADSTFLVIELGDAGVELENYQLDTVEKVWDILLGIIIALARAELSNEFEVCFSLISSHISLTSHSTETCIRVISAFRKTLPHGTLLWQAAPSNSVSPACKSPSSTTVSPAQSYQAVKSHSMISSNASASSTAPKPVKINCSLMLTDGTSPPLSFPFRPKYPTNNSILACAPTSSSAIEVCSHQPGTMTPPVCNLMAIPGSNSHPTPT
jgi:hypothetical protein